MKHYSINHFRHDPNSVKKAIIMMMKMHRVKRLTNLNLLSFENNDHLQSIVLHFNDGENKQKKVLLQKIEIDRYISDYIQFTGFEIENENLNSLETNKPSYVLENIDFKNMFLIYETIFLFFKEFENANSLYDGNVYLENYTDDTYLEKFIKYAEEQNWTVSIEKKNYDIEIGKYSNAGQDFYHHFNAGHNLEELRYNLATSIDDFDVNEETYLWLDNSGHGINGAPYKMKDILEDMESMKNELEEMLKGLRHLMSQTANDATWEPKHEFLAYVEADSKTLKDIYPDEQKKINNNCIYLELHHEEDLQELIEKYPEAKIYWRECVTDESKIFRVHDPERKYFDIKWSIATFNKNCYYNYVDIKNDSDFLKNDYYQNEKKSFKEVKEEIRESTYVGKTVDRLLYENNSVLLVPMYDTVYEYKGFKFHRDYDDLFTEQVYLNSCRENDIKTYPKCFLEILMKNLSSEKNMTEDELLPLIIKAQDYDGENQELYEIKEMIEYTIHTEIKNLEKEDFNIAYNPK